MDNTKHYLDLTGLQYYDGKIKNWVTSQIPNVPTVGAGDASIDVSTDTSGNYLVSVKLANTTLTKDASNGLTVGTVPAAQISIADAGSKFVSTDVEGALAELAQASSGGVASKTVYLSEESSASYAKVYKLYQGSNGSDMTQNTLVGTINIPKDLVVNSGEVKVVTTADTPYQGAVVGDKYIDLVLSSGDHVYIPVKDLVDVYTAAQNATQVQLAISNANVISASIVAGSIGTTELANLSVTTGKLANKAVTTGKIDDEAVGTAQIADGAVTADKLAAAVVSAINTKGVTQVVTGTTPGTISVTTDGTTGDVAVNGLGSAAYEAASAFDAAGAANTAKTQVIGAATDADTANTIYGAKKYADTVSAAAAGAVDVKAAAGDSHINVSKSGTVFTISGTNIADADDLAALDTWQSTGQITNAQIDLLFA